MAVTQEVVLNFLLEQGGKVKNSDLLKRFKPVVESPDPQEKANNRELFKRFVNNIAVVKDEEGTKMVVLKKKYSHLLAGKLEEQGESYSKEEQTQLVPVSVSDSTEEAAASPQETGNSQQEPSEPTLPELQDTTPEATDQAEEVSNLNEDAELQNDAKRESVFDIVSRMDNAGPLPFPKAWSDTQPKEQTQKPYMLPLRYAQTSFEETNQNEDYPSQPSVLLPQAVQEASQIVLPRSPKVARRQLDDTGSKSPHIKRSSKMIKVTEETKYSDVVPLESSEHEWLVSATNGRWNHKLHGLIMTDSDLAGKRDFISGFTALHWAAKSGNTEMVKLLFDLSQKNGSHVNVNARSFGGYTPLHIAAIHEHKDVILLLTRDYNANVNIRDNSGKKPYHYLKKNCPVQLKFILHDPTALNMEHAIPVRKNSKVATSILGTTTAFLGVLSDDVAFHDLTKGLKKPGSLNKFFTAPTGVKKKIKSRDRYPSIASLYEEPEDPEETVEKRRPVSDFFIH